MTSLKLPTFKNVVKNRRRKFLVVLLATLVVLASIRLLLTRSAAAWFNDAWQFRVKIIFTNSGSEVTNQKVKFDIDTAALIAAGKMQNDCGDSRFTTINGVLLRYFIDASGGSCNTNSTDYYVLLPTITAGSNLVYHYYGHPTVTNGSEGANFSEATFTQTPTLNAEEKGQAPVAYWKFDEGHKTTGYDSTPNGNNTLVTNGDDVYGYVEYGDGHDGAKTVSGSDTTSFTSIAINGLSGSGQTYPERLEVTTTTGVASGDDLLIIQMTGTGQGTYEACDVLSIQTDDYISCAENLQNTFQATGAQVVVMPQWTDVTINNGGTLSAAAWDGTTGGIVAFRSTGTITVNSGGKISVNELGFSSGGPGAGGGSAGGGGAGGETTTSAAGGGGGGGGGQGGSYGSQASSPMGGGGGGGGAQRSGAGSSANGGAGGNGTPTNGGAGSKVGANGNAGGGGGGGAGSTGSTGGTGGAGLGTGSAGSDGGNKTGNSSQGGGDGVAGCISSCSSPSTSNHGYTDGNTYGAATLSTLYLGSNGAPGGDGAGGGGSDPGGGGSGGATGGTGGGIIFATGRVISVSGTVEAKGGVGTNATAGTAGTAAYSGGGGGGGGAGGGSGGSIYFKISTAVVGTSLVDATGGTGGTFGSGGSGHNNTSSGGSSSGAGGVGGSLGTGSEGGGGGAGGGGTTGGDGRIHISYNSISGSTNPVADLESLSTLGSADWKSDDFCIDELCIFYDGQNDVSTATSTSLIDFDEVLSNGFTMLAWMRANSDGEADTGRLFQKGENTYVRLTNEGSDGLVDLEAKLDLATQDATLTILNAITLNRWHHIAMTYADDSDDEISIYVDGALLGTSTDGDGSPAADTNNLLIGGKDTANFNGFIDEFKVYASEKTPAQIKSDMLQTASDHGSSAIFGKKSQMYLSDGLVGYWKMDEADWGTPDCSTDVAYDYSGNSFNADACPATTGPTGGEIGKFANGVTLDNTDDYLQIADTPALRFDSSTQDFSLFAWIKRAGTGEADTIFHKWDGASDGYKFEFRTTNTLRCGINANLFTSTSTITDTNWHHVGCVFDRDGNGQIYIDGQPDGDPGIINSEAMATTATLKIGADNGGGSIFNGTIDEARIYNRAFSPDEVRDLYSWSPGPSLNLKLDEGSGTQYTFDSSSYDNNASLDGSMTEFTWIPAKYGAGLNLDGVNDFITVPDKTIISDEESDLDSPAGGSFTVSGWFKHGPQSSGQDTLIAKYNSGGSAGGYQVLMEPDGDITCGIDDDGTSFPEDSVTSTAATYDDDAWHQVTCIKDANNSLALYIDGLFIGSDDTISSTGTLLNTEELHIGRGEDYTTMWFGAVDNFKFYTYAVSPEKLTSDINAGHPAPGSPFGSGVAHWRFDEGYGTTANDATTYDNDLTLSAASWTNSGKYSRAWNGTGANRLTRSDDSDLDFVASDNLTISGWVKSDSATNPSSSEYVVDKEAGSDGYGVYFTTDGKLNFSIGSAANPFPQDTTTSVSDIYDGTWHHFALTKNGIVSTQIYIDGVLNSSDTSLTTTGSMANSDSFILGDRDATDNGDEFFGDIDEVRVFRSSLTVDQVMMLYNQNRSVVFGATSTDSSGNASWSANDEYCPPGQGSTCTAPTAEWKFDEKTGTTANDTTGNANTGTLTNGPTWKHAGTCKFGSCIEFDGGGSADDYINAGSGTTIDDIFDGGGTTSFWFYPRSSGELNGHILNKSSANNGWYINTQPCDASSIDLNVVVDTTGTDGQWRSNCSINLNQWNFVVISYDDDSTTNDPDLYINGVEQTLDLDTNPSTAYVSDASVDLVVGNSDTPAANTTDGLLDNIRFYDYARTQNQIGWEYNHGGPIGWWKFDECSGTTANDSSGRGNDLTITVGGTGTNTSPGSCSSGTSTEAWNNGTTGERNTSIDLDGSDDYSEGDVALVNSYPFTLTAWVKTTGTSSAIVSLVDKDVADTYYMIATHSTGQARLVAQDSGSGSGFNSSTVINDGNWHSVAAVFASETDRKLYVDGKLENSQTGSITYDIGVDRVSVGRLGSSSPTQYLDGQIDDVKVFNYALTEQQITNEYNQGVVHFGP